MNMKYLFYILPALAGIAINNPWVAAFVSFLVGTVILGLIIIGTKQPIPSFEQIKSIQLYKYSGGLLGAFFVTVVIFTVQRIGSANVFALVIASQFIVALLYDHFGLFGLPQTNISWVKILGSVMLIAGAYLVIKK